MFRPKLPGGPPDMFIAGNDPIAKASVAKVLESFGWSTPIDIGGIEGSRELESLCLLWVKSAFALQNFDVAFKLLRSATPGKR
jgi:predicted dinucleotide-binding enzyme